MSDIIKAINVDGARYITSTVFNISGILSCINLYNILNYADMQLCHKCCLMAFLNHGARNKTWLHTYQFDEALILNT